MPPGKRPCFANVLTPGIPCLYLCLRAIRSRRFALDLYIMAYLPHFYARNSVDLISLNKYVVRLIIVQGGCVVYNSLARFFLQLLYTLVCLWATLEKILLLLRPMALSSPECRLRFAHSITELFFHKFVLSSIIRCLKI